MVKCINKDSLWCLSHCRMTQWPYYIFIIHSSSMTRKFQNVYPIMKQLPLILCFAMTKHGSQGMPPTLHQEFEYSDSSATGSEDSDGNYYGVKACDGQQGRTPDYPGLLILRFQEIHPYTHSQAVKNSTVPSRQKLPYVICNILSQFRKFQMTEYELDTKCHSHFRKYQYIYQLDCTWIYQCVFGIGWTHGLS